MVGPVAQGRFRAWQFSEIASEEFAERLAGQVDVGAIAITEIHRNVEQVIDIALVPETVLEHEIEHAGAIGVGIGPDLRAVALVTVRLTLGERRVGKQRGRDRLQGKADAKFLDHVRFAGEVEIDLHGACARHHVEPERADFRHVVAHDLVAAFRHPRHVRAAPLRLETHTEEAETDFVGDGLDFLEVRADFGAGFVDGLERCAREFKLAGRLQGD